MSPQSRRSRCCYYPPLTLSPPNTHIFMKVESEPCRVKAGLGQHVCVSQGPTCHPKPQAGSDPFWGPSVLSLTPRTPTRSASGGRWRRCGMWAWPSSPAPSPPSSPRCPSSSASSPRLPSSARSSPSTQASPSSTRSRSAQPCSASWRPAPSRGPGLPSSKPWALCSWRGPWGWAPAFCSSGVAIRSPCPMGPPYSPATTSGLAHLWSSRWGMRCLFSAPGGTLFAARLQLLMFPDVWARRHPPV